MRRRDVAIAAVMVAMFAAGCSGVHADDSTLPPLRSIADYPAQQSAAVPADAVEWEDYVAGLRAAIEAIAQRHDCVALQNQLTRALADSTGVLRRTGHTTARLVHFIRIELTDTGCVVER